MIMITFKNKLRKRKETFMSIKITMRRNSKDKILRLLNNM